MTQKWLVLVCVLAFLSVGADADCDGYEDPVPLEGILGCATPAYYKDTRTGLCFAGDPGVRNWAAAGMVLVPCGVVEGAAVKAKLEARAQARGQ